MILKKSPEKTEAGYLLKALHQLQDHGLLPPIHQNAPFVNKVSSKWIWHVDMLVLFAFVIVFVPVHSLVCCALCISKLVSWFDEIFVHYICIYAFSDCVINCIHLTTHLQLTALATEKVEQIVLSHVYHLLAYVVLSSPQGRATVFKSIDFESLSEKAKSYADKAINSLIYAARAYMPSSTGLDLMWRTRRARSSSCVHSLNQRQIHLYVLHWSLSNVSCLLSNSMVVHCLLSSQPCSESLFDFTCHTCDGARLVPVDRVTQILHGSVRYVFVYAFRIYAPSCIYIHLFLCTYVYVFDVYIWLWCVALSHSSLFLQACFSTGGSGSTCWGTTRLWRQTIAARWRKCVAY